MCIFGGVNGELHITFALKGEIHVLDILTGVYDVTHKDIVTRHHAESYNTAAWLLR